MPRFPAAELLVSLLCLTQHVNQLEVHIMSTHLKRD
jgi:hypothetical protein